MEKLQALYFLGTYHNDEGVTYCEVFNSSAPEAVKEAIKSQFQNGDVFHQVFFTTEEDFDNQVKSGYARKTPTRPHVNALRPDEVAFLWRQTDFCDETPSGVCRSAIMEHNGRNYASELIEWRNISVRRLYDVTDSFPNVFGTGAILIKEE